MSRSVEDREPEVGGAGDDDEDDESIEWEEFDAPVPPDGGWGWVVAISCFLSNVIVDGVCYTYSVFFQDLLDYFGASKGKTALVGALVPACYLLVGPLASAMCNKFGIRIVTIIGSVMSAAFFVISSFSVNIDMMLVTYGIMGGAGFGLMYLPSIVMPGYYFDKRRALATGVSVCGAGIGTFVFAPLGTFLVETYGWKGANIVIGAINLNGIVFALTYRPLLPQRQKRRVERKTANGAGAEAAKLTIMDKLAAEKRTRTYSVDDKTYEMEKMGAEAAPATLQVPEVLALTTSSQRSLQNKLLNVEGVRSRSRQSSASFTASQRSIAARKQAAANPFNRADIMYTGSLTNTAEYKSLGDMKAYISSVTNIAEDDVPKPKESCPAAAKRILSEMFDFSLLKTVAFVPILGAGVLFFFGLYTPFVYVTQKAVKEIGVTPASASLILSVLGACSTVSRIITGLLADHPRIDCTILHNGAAIIAGITTCSVPLLNSYPLLIAFGAVFGTFTATFIALRSIVLVEILGIQKLTNAFGLTVLFQGIAVLLGSPISGAILDATGSYVYPFLVSGSSIILAGLVCLPVRRVARWEAERAANKARHN